MRTFAPPRSAQGTTLLPSGTFIVFESHVAHEFGREVEWNHSWLLVSGSLIRRELEANQIPCNRPLQFRLAVAGMMEKTLLQDCNWSIAQISQEIGCPNVQYFSRMFRQHFGRCPREARKDAWKNIDLLTRA